MGNAGHKSVGLPGIFLLLSAVLLSSLAPVGMPVPGVADLEARDRWKLADDGTCYFDAEDFGPDQCAPLPGRMKLDASGTCYFDETDSGPNQCGLSLQ